MGRSATVLWCPHCKKDLPCRVVTGADSDYFDGTYGNRFYSTDYEDLQYFLRSRLCSKCENEFQTVELEYKFVDELVRLRNAVKELTLASAAYEETAMETSQKLKTLMTLLHSLERKP